MRTRAMSPVFPAPAGLTAPPVLAVLIAAAPAVPVWRPAGHPAPAQHDAIHPGYPQEPRIARMAAEQPGEERDEADAGPGAAGGPPGRRYPTGGPRREQPGQAEAGPAAPFHRMVGQVVEVDSGQVGQ